MATPKARLMLPPQIHKWTREEYYKMGDAGLFDGRRVELIEGEVFDLSPIHSPHMTGVTLGDDLLRAAFGRGWVVRVQGPLSLGGSSDPEPDIAIVAGQTRDFRDAHPTTAALIVEVADSSLSYDRNHKASLYAGAGILDYWIVNVSGRQLEIYRRPIIDAQAKFGYSYAEKLIFKEEDRVSPLAKPEAVITVADLLP